MTSLATDATDLQIATYQTAVEWGVPLSHAVAYEHRVVESTLKSIRVRHAMPSGPEFIHDGVDPNLHSPVVGLMIDGRFNTNWEECLAAAVQAWGYGYERTVTAEEFAGFVANQREMSLFGGSQQLPESLDMVVGPRDIEIDDVPGVEFWLSSRGGGMGFPTYTGVTVLIRDDGTIDISTVSESIY
jgi:hypothetical protein